MDPTEGKEPDLREATIVSIDESKNIVKKEREREKRVRCVTHVRWDNCRSKIHEAPSCRKEWPQSRVCDTLVTI